ncbi:MAG TPA: beta-galactosidase [Tepidisphaeraceae bacterium]|nr:beta-galactosidase [Tepidisphaeraceae bacterium]
MWKEFYYGVCYYPEHWDPSRHGDDIRRIADCGFGFVRMAEGAWAYFEPSEGQYRFELFDRVIDLCRKVGVKVIMGTPTYAGPAWVSHKYPEVLRWDYYRRPMAHGSRRNFNYTAPKYLELSDRICTALAEHYKDEPQIIAWQLDNEFNCHMDVSYAPSDTEAFRQWLKDKYQSLDKLNDAWGTRFWSQTYDDWSEIDLPAPTATYSNPSQMLDETRFISDCVVRFAARQAAILRKHNPHWQITTNALFSNVNGPNLASVLDFFSHDQYPLFSKSWTQAAGGLVTSRSLSFPFGLLEQQSGPGGQMTYLHRTPRAGEMRLWAWQSIVHGAKLLSYFRWRTCPYGSEEHWHGLLDADDRDNRRVAEAKKVGQELRRIPPAFFDAPPAKAVAVLGDFDNEVNDRRINTYIGEGRWDGALWIAELARRHVQVDQTWPESDWVGYRLLIAPHLKIMTPALAAKLKQFVTAGGTLVLEAQSGSKDVNNHIVQQMPLPGLLAEFAGVEVEDWTTLPPEQTRSAVLGESGGRAGDGTAIAMRHFVERLRPTTAETVAFWGAGDTLLEAAAAITRRPLGDGVVYYVGGYMETDGRSQLAEYLLREAKIDPVVDAPAEVESMLRTSADGEKSYLALLNHSPEAQAIGDMPAGRDVLSDAEVDASAYVLPPFGVAIIEAGE